MNLIFNEVSLLPYNNDYVLKTTFINLIKVYEKAKEYGFQHIVFPSNVRDLKITSDKTFFEWVHQIEHQGDKNKILSIVKKPFSDDVLLEEIHELCKFYYSNFEGGVPDTYCNGLAVAYIKGDLCLSLSTQVFWDEIFIEFNKVTNNTWEKEPVSVINISKLDHFGNEKIKKFLENFVSLELVETTMQPTEKPISLRDDHGKDKLMAFSKRLRNSKYVVAIINSLPFNPKAINLIKNIYPDGKIELVLYWEDKGIGLVVQTTGRNFRETKAIAQNLKVEFDK